MQQVRNYMCQLACWIFIAVTAFQPLNLAAREMNKTFSFNDALIDASDQGRLALVKELLKQNSTVNRRGMFEVTPLMRASFNGHKEIVRLLLVHGAKTDMMDLGGATSLHFAAREGHLDVAELLIQAGAYINATDNQGFTPLMRASAQGNKLMVTLLTERGARLDMENNRGETAMDVAISHKQNAITPILEAAAHNRARSFAQKPAMEIWQKTPASAELHDIVEKVTEKAKAEVTPNIARRDYTIEVKDAPDLRKELAETAPAPAIDIIATAPEVEAAAAPVEAEVPAVEVVAKKEADKDLQPYLDQLASIKENVDNLSLPELRTKIDAFLAENEKLIEQKTESKLEEERNALMKEFASKLSNSTAATRAEAIQMIRDAQLAAIQMESELSLEIAQRDSTNDQSLTTPSMDKIMEIIGESSVKLNHNKNSRGGQTNLTEEDSSLPVMLEKDIQSNVAPVPAAMVAAVSSKPLPAISEEAIVKHEQMSAEIQVQALEINDKPINLLTENPAKKTEKAPIVVKVDSHPEVNAYKPKMIVDAKDLQFIKPFSSRAMFVKFSGFTTKKQAKSYTSSKLKDQDWYYLRGSEKVTPSTKSAGYEAIVGPVESFEHVRAICERMRKPGIACAAVYNTTSPTLALKDSRKRSAS